MKILSSTFIVLAIALCCTGCSHDRAKENEQQCRLLLEEGIARMEQHDLSAAMKRFKEAEQLLTPQSDHRMACRIYEHIAWLNASSGEQQLALIYFDYALPHSWATKDESMVIDVLIGKAHVLNELGETEHAFQVNQQAEALVSHADASQQSTMLKNRAYHQLLHDSIAEAEQNAVRALTLAADTASLGNAFALLSHIYQQQGDTRKLQQLLSRFNESNNTQVSYSRLRIQYEYYLQQHDYQRALEAYRLMQSVGDMMDRSHDQVELLKVQDQYEREASEHEKARQKWWYSLAVIVLMNLVLLIVWWNSRQQHRREREHQQQLRQLRQQMGEKLHAILAAHEADAQQQASRLPTAATSSAALLGDRIFADSIEETKAGIDALYDIVAGNNISQFGKQQERQVAQVLSRVNPALASIIDDSPLPLTPKETFFCIMEHYGKTDAEKAASFCCSEQALRSTKSRLSKKIDIATLKNADENAKNSTYKP